MLPIISPYKELPLLLQPVDHRIRVFLDTCSENNELEPLADFAEEIVAMGSFVHVVEDRVLRTEGCAAAETDGRVEFYFDHMAWGHAAAFCERVDEGFIEVDDESFLREAGFGGLGGEGGGVGGLATRD
jgi:hypothetical protein